MFNVITKDHIIDLREEIISFCWIKRNNLQNDKENNYFRSTNFNNEVWLSGKDKNLLKTLINSINGAKEIICLSTYIFSEPEIKQSLLKACNRGVRIYMLTASNKHLKNLPNEGDEFNTRMFEEMKKLFFEMQGKVKIRTAENFHTKLLLVDPLDYYNRKGFLLTCNLDTKGICGIEIKNEFRVNPEICISLLNNEIIGFFNQFCYGFWELSSEESREDSFLPIKNRIKHDYDYKEILLNTSINKNSLKQGILNLINNSLGTLFIATYTIKDDNEIYQAILENLKKKREIVILTRPKKNNIQALMTLSENGAKIYGHYDTHAKVVLVGNNMGYQGIITTANIDSLSYNNSFESGKYLNNSEANIVNKVLIKWTESFPLEFKQNVKRGEINGEIKIWNKIRSEFETKIVKGDKLIEFGFLTADTIENYEELIMKEADIKKFDEENFIFERLHYRYKVIPPLLPENAKIYKPINQNEKKEKKSKNIFQIYKDNKEFFVVIKDKSEIKKAKVMAETYNARIVTKKEYLIS